MVITGIGPVCRQALSVEDLRGDRAPEPAPGGATEGDWFQVERHLGAKGYKYLTQATRYLLAATARALEDARLTEGAYAPEERGVFAGTNFAVHETLAGMDRTVLSVGAEGLQPMLAPNFSVNVVASHASIKHRYLAFNVTLTSGVVAGIEAALLGAAAIRKGRARHVLAAAVEGSPPPGAGALLGVPRAEGGACVLALESLDRARARGAPLYAALGPGLLRFIGESGSAPLAGLRGALDEVLARLSPRAPIPYCALSAPFARAREVDEIARVAFAARGLSLLPLAAAGHDGSLVAVSPLLALAALAVTHGRGVVLAASPQGNVALLSLEEVAS